MKRIFHRPSRILALFGVWASLLGWFAARADQSIVPTGSIWRFLDNGTDPGTAWRQPAFDDSTWSWGPAELGYGDGDENTVVSYGPNSSAKYITTYFRRSFNVADPAAFTGLTLRVLRDDGVVVYLNGVEVFRNNMPAGSPTAATLATTAISGADETTFLSTSLPTSSLVAGANVLAVEMHQSGGSSSDISFDLELIGVIPGQPNITRGPYLQLAAPGAMTLRWRTSSATDSRVRYGISPTQLTSTVSSAAQTTEHQITLTGLSPNTLYYYAVGNAVGDMLTGVEYHFYSAPIAGASQPTRLWILGDAGIGSTGQVNVRNAYESFNGSRYTDLVLLLGDNAYNSGTDAEYQTGLFNIYPNTFRSTATFSTIGNHDTAGSTNPDINTTPYFQIFNLPTAAEAGGQPSGTEKYYSFDYANIHFVCLDSQTSSRAANSAMLNWLTLDLQNNTADWLIAFWHHPPYSKGSHDSDTETALVEMRQNVLPILESYGVDLVLCGHSHSYERSYLLNGHYGSSTTLTTAMKLDSGSGREAETGAYVKPGAGPNPNQGAVYVVPGSAGQISGGTLNHPAMFISLNQLGSFVIDVDAQRLDARFITDTGAINDHFTLTKGSQPNQPPSVTITSPANGASFTAPSSILLTASASDSDGTIASVAFLANGTTLGTDTTAPFEFSWANPAVGTYSITAVATDNLGAQTTSSPVSISVQASPTPSAPSNLTATPLAKRRIRLNWTDNATTESGFRIERSTNGTTWTQVATVAANVVTWTQSNLTAGVSYSYRVRAYNAAGNSAFSNIATAIAFQ